MCVCAVCAQATPKWGPHQVTIAAPISNLQVYTYTHRDRQTDRQTDRQIHRERERERESERERERL